MTEPEIRQEIEQTREQLGVTVTELAARADVPARARNKAADVKAKAQATAAGASGRVKAAAAGLSGRARHRWPLVLASGLVVAVSVAVWRWRKA